MQKVKFPIVAGIARRLGDQIAIYGQILTSQDYFHHRSGWEKWEWWEMAFNFHWCWDAESRSPIIVGC